MLFLVLLLLLLGSKLGCSAQPAGRETAHVRSDDELYLALTGGTETIVLHNDVALSPEFAKFEGSPLNITRNVTIIGSAGNISDVDAMPVIDLMHQPGILHICSTCSFVFKWVSIAHENQVGTGLGMSVFRGDPGSRLERIGGVGLRTACPPTVPTLFLLNQTQRSPLFPSPPGGQQLAGITNYTYRGELYKDMLLIGDLSSHVPIQQLTNSAFMGGYSIRRRNATRLCEYIVSAQCLQRKLPEDCIAELMANSTMHTADGAAASDARTVAIAVPVAVGGVLVLIGVAAAALWRQRRRQQQTAPTAPNTGKPSPGPAALACQHDIEASGDQGTKPDGPDAWSSAGSNKQRGSTNSIVLMQPAAVGSGPSHLLWSSSAPSTPWEGRDDIELGVLLGAGSFARVYRGRWCGLDVAVKVIQHDMESAKDVANELQLMLNLCHPNIVRAYHCVTKQLVVQPPGSKSAQQTPRAAAPSTSSGAGLVGTDPQQLGSAKRQPTSSTAAPAPVGDMTVAATLPTSTLSSSMHLQDLDPALPPANRRGSWQLAGPGAAGSAATGADDVFHFDAPASSSQGLIGCQSPAATGSQPSTISSSAASVTSGVSSNQAWQLLQAGGSAQFPPLELGSAGLSGVDGGASGTSGGGQGMGLVADKPAVLCESWLVTELCDRGTLARLASEWQPESNEQDMLRLLQLLRDVVCGLKFLKAQHVVHADLNAHNVLVASSSVAHHGLVAKVADLGLSRVLKQHATHRTTQTVGMLTHQPPELLRDGKMWPAGDIYSFGIMMFEVFTRHVAYPRLRYGQIYHQVVVLGVRPAVPADMPEDYELLMKRCWSAEPSDRPTVDMLLDCLDLMIEDRQEQ